MYDGSLAAREEGASARMQKYAELLKSISGFFRKNLGVVECPQGLDGHGLGGGAGGQN
jgi:hypothetical protein